MQIDKIEFFRLNVTSSWISHWNLFWSASLDHSTLNFSHCQNEFLRWTKWDSKALSKTFERLGWESRFKKENVVKTYVMTKERFIRFKMLFDPRTCKRLERIDELEIHGLERREWDRQNATVRVEFEACQIAVDSDCSCQRLSWKRKPSGITILIEGQWTKVGGVLYNKTNCSIF